LPFLGEVREKLRELQHDLLSEQVRRIDISKAIRLN
jgi:uncharacterized protein YaaR (DUF327 family)